MGNSELESHIKTILSDVENVKVESEDGQHFRVTVVSPFFIGKSLLESHRYVYKALNNYIASGEMHAVSIKTMTPSEWQQAQLF